MASIAATSAVASGAADAAGAAADVVVARADDVLSSAISALSAYMVCVYYKESNVNKMQSAKNILQKLIRY